MSRYPAVNVAAVEDALTGAGRRKLARVLPEYFAAIDGFMSGLNADATGQSDA